MLTILQQPTTALNPPDAIRQPVVYVIQTDDQTPVPGNSPRFRVRFTSTDAVQDSFITIMGIQLRVDNTQPARVDSFNSVGPIGQVVNSFRDMLRLRFELRNFIITTELVGGFFEVVAQGFVDERIAPDLWVFDISSIAVDMGATLVSQSNGNEPILRDVALWYRVDATQGGLPMWQEQIARFSFSPDAALEGICRIDISAVVWGSMRFPHPDLQLTGARLWPDAMAQWVLKYAQIDIGDNCTQEPGQLYTSLAAQSLPVVLQPEDLEGTERFVFDGFLVKQYLSRRPQTAFACEGVHEFICFPFVGSEFISSGVRVIYEVGIWGSGVLLDIETYEYATLAQGIYEVGIGHANADIQALLAANPTANFWNVRIEMFRKFGASGYYLAHTLTRRLGGDCKCPDLELYYLEDFCSYRTLRLFRAEEETQEQQSVTGAQSIDWDSTDASSILPRGGRSSKTIRANERLTYRTEIMPNKGDSDGIYSELLRCKQAYIKDRMQPGYIRKIAIERVDITKAIAGEAQVFNITFRYNTGITVRP